MSIRVLLAEDAPEIQEHLIHLIESDNRFQIAGVVDNGHDAVKLAISLRPDVIAMDASLPGLNGLDAATQIMTTAPVPIVVISTNLDPNNQNDVFKTLQAGAVSLVGKPSPGSDNPKNETSRLFLQTLRLMSEIKVVRRLNRRTTAAKGPDDNSSLPLPAVVAIGASTGGPQVIEAILAGLNDRFSLPIIIVQHITSGFLDGFVSWLNMSSKVVVVEGRHNEKILPGYCYVAPDDFHVTITPDLILKLTSSPREHGVRPSISVLMRSIASSFPNKSVGILLSGMGKDGAYELAQVKATGSVTIIQDEQSSLIFGIPGEARKLHAATFELSPDEIIEYLNKVDLAHKNM
ncbi:MAG: chemotaxis protein CheB [Ignavibacteria bacterium]|nr:chemotaxis protein CheB [Ignavibacteria bacterium]